MQSSGEKPLCKFFKASERELMDAWRERGLKWEQKGKLEGPCDTDSKAGPDTLRA